MNKSNLRKQFLTVALGVALSLGAASHASAAIAPLFTYDLDGVAGGTTVVGNALGGGSSDYLQAISATQFAGAGWMQVDAIKLNSSTLAGTSFADTGLYATFQLQTSLLTGAFGQSNSTYKIDALTFQLFYDAGKNNSFIQGNATTGQQAVVNVVGVDKLLATGTLLGGDAGLHSTFGASINAMTKLTLTADGMNFFIAPDPFYAYAFEGFNSTGNSWEYNPLTGGLSVGNATGIVDFIPEPGSLALFGLALAGLGGFTRRNKQVK